jgi:hypothetical protein
MSRLLTLKTRSGALTSCRRLDKFAILTLAHAPAERTRPHRSSHQNTVGAAVATRTQSAKTALKFCPLTTCSCCRRG